MMAFTLHWETLSFLLDTLIHPHPSKAFVLSRLMVNEDRGQCGVVSEDRSGMQTRSHPSRPLLCGLCRSSLCPCGSAVPRGAR